MDRELLNLDWSNLRPLRTLRDSGGNGKKNFTWEKYLKTVERHNRQLRKGQQLPDEFGSPLGCQLELTARCNQRCIMCYNRSGAEETFPHGKEMSVDEWLDVAGQLRKMGVFQVIISGGEPTLLGDDLFRIMDVFRDEPVRFLVITNGMLLDRDTVKRFAQYRYNFMQISIDGASPEVHDYLRQAKGGWQKAVRGARLVKEAGIPLVIAHTVTAQNLSTLRDMVELAFYLGAARIILGIYMYSGRAILHNKTLSLSEKERQEYWRLFEELSKEYTDAERMEVYDAMDEAAAFRLGVIQPNQVMLIRPGGDVKVDCALPFTIGNVRSEPLKDIWAKRGKSIHRSPQVRDYVKKIRSENDLLTVRPRPYVDEDLRITGEIGAER